MPEISLPPITDTIDPHIRMGFSIGNNPVHESMLHRNSNPLEIRHDHKPSIWDSRTWGATQPDYITFEPNDFLHRLQSGHTPTRSDRLRYQTTRGFRAGVFRDVADDTDSRERHNVSLHRISQDHTSIPRRRVRRGFEAGVAVNGRTVAATLAASALVSSVGVPDLLEPFVIRIDTEDKIIPLGLRQVERDIPFQEQEFVTTRQRSEPTFSTGPTFGSVSTTEEFSKEFTIPMIWSETFGPNAKIGLANAAPLDAVYDLVDQEGIDIDSIVIRGYSDATDDTRDGVAGVQTQTAGNQAIADARGEFIAREIVGNTTVDSTVVSQAFDHIAEDSFTDAELETLQVLSEKYGRLPDELIEQFHRGAISEAEIIAWGTEEIDAEQRVEVTVAGTTTSTATGVTGEQEFCDIRETVTEVPINETEMVTEQNEIGLPDVSLAILPLFLYAARRMRVHKRRVEPLSENAEAIRRAIESELSPQQQIRLPRLQTGRGSGGSGAGRVPTSRGSTGATPTTPRTPSPTTSPRPNTGSAPNTPARTPQPRPEATPPASTVVRPPRPTIRETLRQWRFPALVGGGVVAAVILLSMCDSDPDLPNYDFSVPRIESDGNPPSEPELESKECKITTVSTDRNGEVSISSADTTIIVEK